MSDSSNIVKLFDDCGHDLGYYNLNSAEGRYMCKSALLEAFKNYEVSPLDIEAIENLNEDKITYSFINKLLQFSFLVYCENIDVIG